MKNLNEPVTWSNLFSSGENKPKSWLTLLYEIFGMAIFVGFLFFLKDDNGVPYITLFTEGFPRYIFLGFIGARVIFLAKDIRTKLKSQDESY